MQTVNAIPRLLQSGQHKKPDIFEGCAWHQVCWRTRARLKRALEEARATWTWRCKKGEQSPIYNNGAPCRPTEDFLNINVRNVVAMLFGLLSLLRLEFKQLSYRCVMQATIHSATTLSQALTESTNDTTNWCTTFAHVLSKHYPC